LLLKSCQAELVEAGLKTRSGCIKTKSHFLNTHRLGQAQTDRLSREAALKFGISVFYF